jgi:uncharacterized protein YdaU (DUF1376 family)
MSQAPVMPIWTDALIGDTTHLSAEQFGAYCLILFATWRNNGKPLPNDDALLARVCRASKTHYKAKLKAWVLPFFDISDGYLHQKRLEKEWFRVQNFVEKQRRNGKLGGRPKLLKTQETTKPSGSVWLNPNESQTKATKPIPIKKEDTGAIAPESNGTKPASPQIGALMVEVWNLETTGSGLRAVMKVHPTRIAKCKSRFVDDFGNDIEKWRECVRRVVASQFLVGNNSHSFKASFDWVLEPRNLAKILEGNYDGEINGGLFNGGQRGKERGLNRAIQEAQDWVASRKRDRALLGETDTSE